MGLPIMPDQENTAQESADQKPGAEQDCLAGGGVMGAMMRSVDWSQTSLGPAKNWSPALCTTISVCLNSRFPILIWWGEALIMLYNDAYRPILGQKHPRALGQPSSACFPEIWDTIEPMLSRVLAEGEATWSEDQLLLLDRNGYLEECFLTFSYSPIREGSAIGGVFTAVTETTKRVLAERRLKSLLDLAASMAAGTNVAQTCTLAAEALVKNAGDIPFALLYLLSEDGKQAQLQEAAGSLDGPQLVKLEDEEAGSLGWSFTLAARTGQPLLAKDLPLHAAMPAEDPLAQTAQNALVIPVSQAGQDMPYGLLVAGINPRRALDEPYRGFLILAAGQIATAISSARALEAEQRRSTLLSEQDRAKTEFFSNISHEFRTPLTLMLGPVQDALQSGDPNLSEANRERLQTVYRNGLHLLKLVNTLLDFTRLESGRVVAEFEPVDLSALTSELASVFRAAIENAGLRLVVDCPPLPKPVYVDRDMWEKIVLNLLSNAFKFTLSGEVGVALHWQGDFVTLEVRDTGIGIASEDLPHIFDRFHRVHSARARTYEGSGIGLSLVRELARLHGGQVTVESVPDKGTTFMVTIRTGTAHLPARQTHPSRTSFSTNIGTLAYVADSVRWLPQVTRQPEPVTEDSEAVDDETAPADALLLIVDDNADMQDYLSRLLSPYWQVAVVSNGIEALEAVRRQLPDLIISDVMMPGMDGIELLHRLRTDRKTREIPIILLSARASEEQRIDGLAQGADDYLVKPFSARELIARIESRLELTALRREAQRSLIDQQFEYHTRLEVHRQLLESREMERQQIARELHDGPIQDLIGLMYSLQSVLALTEDDSMDEFLRGLRDTVQKLVIELRVVCNELRPPSLVQFGLERAIRSHVEAFQEKHEQLKIHTKMAEDGRLLPEKYRLALYRIYQECLNNVVRHAHASEVNISLDVEAHSITLEVADNGCGFQVPTDWVVLARHGHLGLVGMQERAEAIGGQMQVFSEPGSTRVRVSVPLPQEKQG